MIYLVIADLKNIERDCRAMRQPHNLLQKEIKEYIAQTKNKKIKLERTLAYSTLFFSMKKFFPYEKCDIERNKNGKPYFKNSNINFSISHCDDIAVVALTDEKQIGVDIQSVIDEAKASRIEKRFLSKIDIIQKEVNIKYFLINFDGDNVIFENVLLNQDTNIDFLSKWVYTESVIKAFSLSFSDISKINELLVNTESCIVTYENLKIAITIEK